MKTLHLQIRKNLRFIQHEKELATILQYSLALNELPLIHKEVILLCYFARDWKYQPFLLLLLHYSHFQSDSMYAHQLAKGFLNTPEIFSIKQFLSCSFLILIPPNQWYFLVLIPRSIGVLVDDQSDCAELILTSRLYFDNCFQYLDVFCVWYEINN